ncbi:MAG: transcription-repair coupling factor [Christensenellales bacterium]|jgi:transcription-repair coupling factor (superfamily II helicase)
MILDKILTSEYLGGDFVRLKEAIKKNQDSIAFTNSAGSKRHITCMQERFFVYITQNSVQAREAADAFSEMLDKEVVYIPHKEEILLFAKTYISRTLPERLEALYKILSGQACGCTISIEGLTQYFPDKNVFLSLTQKIEKGKEINLDALTGLMAKSGYERVVSVEQKGCFSVRGDIVDIWPPHLPLPVRVELYGESVEDIKLFAYDTQMSVKAIDSVVIIPNSDLLVSEERHIRIIGQLQELAETSFKTTAEIISEVLARFAANPFDASLVWLIPFMKKDMALLADYLPADALIVFEDAFEAEAALSRYYEVHNLRCANFIKSGEILPEHRKSCIDYNETLKQLQPFVKLAFLSHNIANPLFYANKVYNFNAFAPPQYYRSLNSLVGDCVLHVKNGNKVLIYAGSRISQDALNLLFMDNGLKADLADEWRGAEITLLPYKLKNGFIYNDYKISVIGTEEIGRPKIKRDKIKARKEDAVLPREGHYVVHERYGIGLSQGIKTINTQGVERDYYVVKYAGDDLLYVPAENIDSLELYLGESAPKLHSLSGAEFERIKARVKGSVKKMAIDLLQLYEKRNSLKGHKYGPDTPWQEEMEESFEFAPTDDQIIATAEIKEDMEKGKIMDRLLCGDVGFGKTEVAIRAIFKTVLEGKQACVLAPTTILAEQHFNTISERLADYGLKIALLSRFVAPSEIKASLKAIKSGDINIIVGTHRVLSNDVEFADLGLLVLDEEQRFGVEHKEKIKHLKNTVNVLTMSATPIPRTLHMALTGIRDISTLETPPEGRHPIETYVTEYTDTLLTDAVLREVSRGGQVFILYNKVESITGFYKKVTGLLGTSIRVIYVHGQMEAEVLEKRIRSFYQKQADVMISTTIIENGIDIPDANTLIVIDADRLGLSQLYQIRGRVGRSHRLAYAYLTYDGNKILSENAVKRLRAITDFTSLGSGFKIAKQDLMIRGAGNIIGPEQHGNMGKVGYDMFSRLIKESVEELKGNTPKKKRDITLSIEFATNIPRDYIADNTERVKAYKRISMLNSMAELDNLAAELKDIYGRLPLPAHSLMYAGLIKNLAGELNVKSFVIKKKEAKLSFADNSCYSDAKLMNALSEYSAFATLSAGKTPTVIFKLDNMDELSALKTLAQFMEKGAS